MGKNNLTTYSYLCSSGKTEKQLNMMTFPGEGSSHFKPTLNAPPHDKRADLVLEIGGGA